MKRQEFLNLTKEVKQEIIYKYDVLKFSQIRLMKEYSLSETQLKKLLKKNKIHIRGISEVNTKTKYTLDVDFFKKQSGDLAYFLGLFGADGNIHKKDNIFYIELQRQDKEILEKIRKRINLSREVKDYCTGRGFENSKIYFYSKELKEYFRDNYDLMPNKTYNENFKYPHTLENRHFLDYVRGYFDGDGSIKKTGCSLTFQIDANESIAHSIKDKFKELYNIDLQITANQQKNLQLYRVYCYGDKAKEVFKLLYATQSAKDGMYMKRKHNRFLELTKDN